MQILNRINESRINMIHNYFFKDILSTRLGLEPKTFPKFICQNRWGALPSELSGRYIQIIYNKKI